MESRERRPPLERTQQQAGRKGVLHSSPESQGPGLLTNRPFVTWGPSAVTFPRSALGHSPNCLRLHLQLFLPAGVSVNAPSPSMWRPFQRTNQHWKEQKICEGWEKFVEEDAFTVLQEKKRSNVLCHGSELAKQ